MPVSSTLDFRVRVSCAAADNMVFPGATHGFVTTLATTLQVRLGQLTGTPDLCEVGLDVAVEDRGLLLVVLSPAWLADPACASALEDFAAAQDDATARVLIVELAPIPIEDRPRPLSNLPAGRLWRPRDGGFQVLGIQTPLSDPEYRDVIEDLARGIIEQTEQLAAQAPTGGAHVFLCHNSRDKDTVKGVAIRLKSAGHRPWLDEWELRPGHPWQSDLEEKLGTSGAALICIGPAGIGTWQEKEVRVLLELQAKHGITVMPVILEGGPAVETLDPALQKLQTVDFNRNTRNPWDDLQHGLTGDRPDHRPVILLAEVPDDMDSRRRAVMRTLDQAGYNVVPKRWYPRAPVEFQDAVDRDLADAVAFVQLLGATPCRRPAGAAHSYSTLQYERALHAGRPLLQWRDPSLDVATIQDADHRALVDGPKVRAMNLEEFKRGVIDAAGEEQRLRARAENRLEEHGDGGGFVFINASPGDVEIAERLAGLLSERGHICEWTTEDDHDDVEFIRDNITSSDGLIIVWGEDKRWVRRQGKEVRALWSKVKGSLKSFAVLKGPPPKENTSLGMSIPRMQLIDCHDGLEMNSLREFVAVLERGGDA
jgi:hypothetical protein